MRKIYEYIEKNSLFLAWVVGAVSFAGSMALSEILDLPPCRLCWWQRIFMFSVAIILTAALYFKDRLVYRYALPLVIPGLLFAGYHTLLQFGIIRLAPTCEIGESCTEKQLELLGFITIPMMAFAAFLVLSILLYILMKSGKAEQK